MRVAALLLLLAAPVAAQEQLHRWDGDQWQHLVVGAGVALAMRGPWITPSWRNQPWKRGLTQLILVLGFEVYQRLEFGALDNLDTGLDILAGMAGWALVEVGVLAWNELFE